MDARDGTPSEDLTSFLSGMEFGLLTLQGRLRRMEDPSPADLLAAIEDVRDQGRRIRETKTADDGVVADRPRPRRRR